MLAALPLLVRLAAPAAIDDVLSAAASVEGAVTSDVPSSAAAPVEGAAALSPDAAPPVAPPAAATRGAPPPAAPTDARPGPRRVKRSLATTAWPVEPAVAAGFVLAGDAMVPWAGATAFAPLYFSAGPVVAGRVLGTSTGSLDVVEGVVGLGVGWQGRLGEARARASVVPGVLVSDGRRPSGALVAPGGTVGLPGGTGPLTSAAVMVPLELGLPLGGGVSFTGVVEPTISTEAAYVDETGFVAYARNRLFVFVGVGLDVGGPID